MRQLINVIHLNSSICAKKNHRRKGIPGDGYALLMISKT
jgi:hypothetical protein